ncbi:MAG: hypothetical protein ACI8XW_000098, partial [Gammaproteobacteria bacterium]
QSDGGPTPQYLSKQNPLKPSKAMAAQRPNTYRSKTHSSQAKRWRPNAPIPIEAKPTQAEQSDGGTTPQYLSKQPFPTAPEHFLAERFLRVQGGDRRESRSVRKVHEGFPPITNAAIVKIDR